MKLYRIFGNLRFGKFGTLRNEGIMPFFFGYRDSNTELDARDSAIFIENLVRATRSAELYDADLSAEEIGVMQEIDGDITVKELADMWLNGNRKEVIDRLENDHPGLTAMLLIQGRLDHDLGATDCNAIANMLMDRRKARFDAYNPD